MNNSFVNGFAFGFPQEGKKYFSIEIMNIYPADKDCLAGTDKALLKLLKDAKKKTKGVLDYYDGDFSEEFEDYLAEIEDETLDAGFDLYAGPIITHALFDGELTLTEDQIEKMTPVPSKEVENILQHIKENYTLVNI